jgi:predicted PurR-regulated permease PerM
MPVVLIGALGGLAGAGILGMFLGATALSLGYQILMRWVATDPDVVDLVELEGEPPVVS